MYNLYSISLSKYNVMKTFWEKVAGKSRIDFESGYHILPLNYKTDDKTVMYEEEQGLLPILDLRGILKYSSLSEMRQDSEAIKSDGSTKPGDDHRVYFEDALTEYVRTYFESEKNWTTPIEHCLNQEDQLLFCLASLWQNATFSDYENPIEFIRRYTDFIKDNTFEELDNKKSLIGIQTLKNASLQIQSIQQNEHQETPEAMQFTVSKNGVEKRLPRIAYGISNGEAYIYGIQGYKTQEDPPEIKPVNRARYKLYNEKNYPEDYRNFFKRLEPYAYLSLFAFLCLLKEKGITRVKMPAILPERYESKEIVSKIKQAEEIKTIEGQTLKRKDRRKAIHNLKKREDEHSRIQYAITNKFLGYMSRLQCDVPGIESFAYPEQTNGYLITDISNMTVSPENNVIFYEVYRKIQEMYKAMEKMEKDER